MLSNDKGQWSTIYGISRSKIVLNLSLTDKLNVMVLQWSGNRDQIYPVYVLLPYSTKQWYWDKKD